MGGLHNTKVAESGGPMTRVQRHSLPRVLAKCEQHGGGFAILPWLLYC